MGAALAAAGPYIADALVLLGVLILTVGVYGAFWMPDIYTKLHSTSVVVAFGVIAISLAALFAGVPAISARVVLIVSIIGMTAPIGAFAMARAAYLRDEQIVDPDAVDESGRELVAGDGGRAQATQGRADPL